jgi:hypothetical protein
VKYKGPIKRDAVFHHINCDLCFGVHSVVNIEFAYAHGMKKAQCCYPPYNKEALASEDRAASGGAC